MKINNHKPGELEKARELQAEAAKLHIPMPVMSWKYEIKDENGDVVEKGEGKSNSYVRNALNTLAYFLGLASSSKCTSATFADGFISLKDTAGSLYGMSGYYGPRNSSTNAVVLLGTSEDAESVDSYTLPGGFGSATGTTVYTAFDDATRKLTTLLSRAYVNTTGAAVAVTESGLSIDAYVGSSKTYLIVRDAFDAITVEAGKSIVWTYCTEVIYPAA